MSEAGEGISIQEAVKRKKENMAAQRAEASEAGRKLAAARHAKPQDDPAPEVIDNAEPITEDDAASGDVEAEDRATGTDDVVEASAEDGEAAAESEAEHDAEEGSRNLAEHFGNDWEQARNEYTIPYRENGEDKVATLGEAQNALSKSGDYGTRNAAFKEKVQAKEAELAEAEQRINGTLQHLKAVHQNVANVFAGNPPERALLDANSDKYNPDEYHRQLADHQDNLGKLQVFGQQLQQYEAQLVESQKTLVEKGKAQEMERLRTHWPNVDAEWPATVDAAVKHYGSLGATREQFEALPTAVARAIVRDAVKAQKTAAVVKDTKRQLTKLPKLKTNRPGGLREPGEGAKRALDQKQARVRSTGKQSDAVEFLKAKRDLARQQRQM